MLGEGLSWQMNSAPQIGKAGRNLKALFALALLLTLLVSVCGGFMSVAGNPHPDRTLTLPVWESGQFLLHLGLTNLIVYACIFLQVRVLICGARVENSA
jgi:hypothetical protein